MLSERYSRNIPAISEEQQESLAAKHVLVVGCGGLGGHLIEFMVRLGVGCITAVDGDRFECSNLNRQLLSSVDVLGCPKAEEACRRAKLINPSVCVRPVPEFFTAENADALTAGQDLVLDALDNRDARLLLEDACERNGVPLVHGAIQGWKAQVSVILPGMRLLHTIYSADSGVHSKTSLPFTPAWCAAAQAAEAAKLLCTGESSLAGKLLIADLFSMSTEVFDIR